MPDIVISVDILIDTAITQGSSCNFSPKTGVTNHHYVIINSNPLTDDELYLVMFTTKKDRVKDFVMNNPKLDLRTFVEIEAGECQFLPKWGETCINCNSVLTVDRTTLKELIKNSSGRVKHTVEETVLNRIIKGVRLSPLVKRKIKDLI